MNVSSAADKHRLQIMGRNQLATPAVVVLLVRQTSVWHALL